MNSAVERISSVGEEGNAQGARKSQKKHRRNSRPGDWKCGSCNNYNYSFREQCNRCETMKSDTINIVVVASRRNNERRAGDWVCIICNNLNYSFRKECNRCSADKLVRDEKDIPGGWKCPQCTYRNLGRHIQCHYCDMLRNIMTCGYLQNGYPMQQPMMYWPMNVATQFHVPITSDVVGMPNNLVQQMQAVRPEYTDEQLSLQLTSDPPVIPPGNTQAAEVLPSSTRDAYMLMPLYMSTQQQQLQRQQQQLQQQQQQQMMIHEYNVMSLVPQLSSDASLTNVGRPTSSAPGQPAEGVVQSIPVDPSFQYLMLNAQYQQKSPMFIVEESTSAPAHKELSSRPTYTGSAGVVGDRSHSGTPPLARAS